MASCAKCCASMPNYIEIGDSMTLIVTAATPLFVLQAADRLITRQVAHKIEEYDAVSNKSIIYEALDGLLAISYCGNAYIDGLPTDEWIAMQLHPGVKNMYGDGPDPSAIQISPLADGDILTVDGVLQRLRERLEDLPAHTVRPYGGITLAISGRRLNGPGTPSVLVEFKRSERTREAVEATGFKRRPGVKQNSGVMWNGSGSTDEVQTCFEDAWKLIHQGNPPSLWEEFLAHFNSVRDAAVSAIHLAASRNPTVGPNVHITTIISRPGGALVAKTEFVATVNHPATIYTPTRTVHVPNAAVTSWILTANACLAPSYLVGPWVTQGKHSVIEMHGAPGQGGVHNFFQTVPRRRS